MIHAVDIEGQSPYTLASGGDLSGIEEIDGRRGNDTITGNTGDDLIEGDQGNDVLRGREGDDTLIRGSGDDILFTAGTDQTDMSFEDLSGQDVFVGGSGGGWTDVIQMDSAANLANDPDSPWSIQ